MAPSRKSRIKRRQRWASGVHPACGSTEREHRAAHCDDCRAEYNRRRRVPLGEKKRRGAPPPCGSGDPAHRRRECRGCKRYYERLTWRKRAPRIRKAFSAAPPEVRAPRIERDRLRARAWATVRRRDIARRCAEAACDSHDLVLRYLDTDEGVIVAFACRRHRNLVMQALAERQAAMVEDRALDLPPRTLSPTLGYDEALHIARTRFADDFDRLQNDAQHVAGVPIPVPIGSPLYRKHFATLVAARLRPS